MEKVWDPLRKKMVTLTPEERVRQWFITLLHEECSIPLHMMSSEVSLRYGDKPFRADIVVWDRSLCPAVIVECKRPQVTLDEEVLSQVLKYNMVMGAPYAVVTNGHSTHIVHEGGFITQLPNYETICQL